MGIKYKSGEAEQDRVDFLQPGNSNFERFYGKKDSDDVMRRKPEFNEGKYIDLDEVNYDPSKVTRKIYY